MPTNIGHRLAEVLAARNRAEARAREEAARIRAELDRTLDRFRTRFLPALRTAVDDANRGLAGYVVLALNVVDHDGITAEAFCAIEEADNPFPATIEFKMQPAGTVVISSRKATGAMPLPSFAATVTLSDDNTAEIDEALFSFVTHHLDMPKPEAGVP